LLTLQNERKKFQSTIDTRKKEFDTTRTRDSTS